MRIFAIAAALCASSCTPTVASNDVHTASNGADVSHRVLRPSEFQSFVNYWGKEAPLCARISSAADWDRYFGAAAVAGGNQAFAPPADLWRTHTGFLLARVADGAAEIDSILTVQSVRRRSKRTQVDTALNQGDPGFQEKTYVLVAIEKPISGTVDFTDRGRPVCSVRA